MIAEAEAPPIKPKKSSTRGPHPFAGKMQAKIDLLTRAQARNLYVVRQLSAQEVASQLGLNAKQIYSLAEREGWTKTRAEIKRKSLEASQARESEDIDELVEAVAVKSSVLSLGTLDSAIEEMKTPGEFQAKNLQALSVAAKNFVGIYRQAKNLDVTATEKNTTNILFMGTFERVSAAPSAPEEKRVSGECIDVPTTQGESAPSKA